MIAWCKKHYHWVIAAILLIQLGIFGGAANNFTGLHMVPVTESLGISRTTFSLLGSFRAIVSIGSTLMSGMLIMRLGYRFSLTACLFLGACSYVIYGFADNIYIWIIGDILYGLCVGLCSSSGVGAPRVITAWFHKHRGTVLGVVTAATGFGGSLMSILQNAMIEKYTWRGSFFAVAILTFGCAVMMALLMREHPSKVGLKPYGEGEIVEHKKSKHHTRMWEGRSMPELYKKPVFYMLFASAFTSCLAVYLVFSNLSPHLQQMGLSATDANTIHGLQLFFLAGTKLLVGVLCDRLGSKFTTLLCLVFTAAGVFLLSNTTTFPMAVMAAAVFTVGVPLTGVIMPLLSVDLLGYKSQGHYIGIFMSAISASSILSGPISNGLFDAVGSYLPAIYISIALCSACFVLNLVMYRIAAKDQKAWETGK